MPEVMEELKKITIINLTEHTIRILEPECFLYKVEPRVKVEYPPSGVVVRAQHNTKNVGMYQDQNGIPIQITTTVYNPICELPEQKPGVFYIVSKLIAELGMWKRDDLLVVSNKFYHEGGKVFGVKGLAKLNPRNYVGPMV